MLEVVASQDLWRWHSFFGASGSNSDINVLDQSPIYNDLIAGMAPGQQFICNDTTYKYVYYLVDGIYPQWATLVKSFTTRQTEDDRRLYFQNRQEGQERILNEHSAQAICEFYEEDDPNLLEHVEISDEEKQANRRMLRNEDTHANLKSDLIEHLWKNREV
ncbi:hypothetical protein E3N88_31430 [Mikania micrantha]|uniref:Uncharacterized protein n=1 Tax=Mikania micrantha TaxID=192012 RepID=A0A5N6MQA7_9ASTR|nr:hypothetical protein E3N88_31430 [Mikania micrantha]